MTTFFTSDLHLGHRDILAFSQRPWRSIEEHDKAVIQRINETVSADDELYILGDFAYEATDRHIRKALQAIQCKNRYLVLGNHDDSRELFKPGAFLEVCDYLEVIVNGRMCCLSHYPMLDWNMGSTHLGVPPSEMSFMLHGHIHSQGKASNGDNARAGVWRYDVGLDANGYRPVSFEQIDAFMRERDERGLF